MMRRGLLVVASYLALVAGCRLNPECFGSSECSEGTSCFEGECFPSAPDGGTYTWWQDVEPIVRERCQICHDNPPINGAPISLISYANVTAEASTGLPVHREMYARVRSTEAPMPPPPDSVLSSSEIDVIRTWTREGAPEGDPPFSWYQDVQPIVIERCLGCHSDPPRNRAPVPLVTWENTQVNGSGNRPLHVIMAQRVDQQMNYMPPTGRLQIGQINLIRAWSRIGAPRGNPNQLPDGGTPDVGMPTTPSPLEGIGALDQISTGYVFLEGPDWREPTNVLVFADVAGDTIYQLTPPNTVAPLRTPSGQTSGLRVDQDDQLVAAEQDSRSITRMDDQGAVQTIIDRYQNNRFNSPNDLAVRQTDGTIYFTDPPLGLNGRPREIQFNGLFRISPAGIVHAEWEGPEASQPNGLELSPDETTLYMSDSADSLVRAFDVNADGSLSNERIFVYTESGPDGIAPDEDGNIFVATRSGVQVFASNGWSWGTIPMAETPTNLAFGGADRRTLYVTTPTTLYAVAVQIPGTRWTRGAPDAGANPIDGVGPAEGFGPMTYQFLEGPDWDRANGRLVFSDIPASTVYEFVPPDTFNTIRMPSGMTNGLFVEESGSILMAEHEGRRLARMQTDMTVEAVADDYNGMLFNSPNDVIARSDGTIYFSDPDYGNNVAQLAFNGVFRLTPGGALTAEWEANTMDEQPNGLAFSPDESILYVTDSVGERVYSFEVAADGALMSMALFVEAMGTLPDGLAVDRDGNVYLASSIGVEVYAPDGTHWGNIAVAEAPSNLVFGGDELRTLYITTARRLYRVDVPIPAP